MYKWILLAADDTREGLSALREGALLAASAAARVHLLVIERQGPASRMADGIHPLPRSDEGHRLLAYGLRRLGRLGVAASGEVCEGDPAQVIGATAKAFRPDLIVLGHRRQSFLDRWWSGPAGAHVIDNVTCSVLIARNLVSDETFEARLRLVSEEG